MQKLTIKISLPWLRWLNLPIVELFFFLFKHNVTLERHLFSIKMKEIIKKLQIEYQVGLGKV